VETPGGIYDPFLVALTGHLGVAELTGGFNLEDSPEQFAQGAVGLPVHLPAHHTAAVGARALAGGLDVAQVLAAR